MPHGKRRPVSEDTEPSSRKRAIAPDAAEHADPEHDGEAHGASLARRTRLVAAATARKPTTMLAAA